MAVTRTVLTAKCGASDVILSVANTAVGFPPVGVVLGANHQPLTVDNESMFVYFVPQPGVIQVRSRGAEGQVAVAHDVGAPVVTSALVQDFPLGIFGVGTLHDITAPDEVTLGSNGIIAGPFKDTRVILAATTPMAMTLLPPHLAFNGIRLTISSQTAQAHVVTGTGIIFSGTVGAPAGILTFAATIGASVLLEADAGVWVVNATVGVTLT